MLDLCVNVGLFKWLCSRLLTCSDDRWIRFIRRPINQLCHVFVWVLCMALVGPFHTCRGPLTMLVELLVALERILLDSSEDF